MKRKVHALILGTAILAVLAVAAPSLRAEQTPFFENPTDISRAQGILVKEGYLEAASYSSGRLDGETREALAAFQVRHSLNSTGNLDDNTFQELLSHEVAYPWGGEEPMTVAKAEPVEPVSAASAPEYVPEPTPAVAPSPSTVEVKEAPVPEPTPAPAYEQRTMPGTSSPLPAIVLAGLMLITAGAVVLRFRKV